MLACSLWGRTVDVSVSLLIRKQLGDRSTRSTPASLPFPHPSPSGPQPLLPGAVSCTKCDHKYSSTGRLAASLTCACAPFCLDPLAWVGSCSPQSGSHLGQCHCSQTGSAATAQGPHHPATTPEDLGSVVQMHAPSPSPPHTHSQLPRYAPTRLYDAHRTHSHRDQNTVGALWPGSTQMPQRTDAELIPQLSHH